MSEAAVGELLLAAALPAPFAFRLAAVARDGGESRLGLIYLMLCGSIAAVIQFFTGSVWLAVPTALMAIILLAHVRFLGAHRAPLSADGSQTTPSTVSEEGVPPGALAPDPLHAGMVFVGNMIETVDRMGELRHKLRLRRIERQQVERQAGARRSPKHQLIVQPRRLGDAPATIKKLPPPDKP